MPAAPGSLCDRSPFGLPSGGDPFLDAGESLHDPVVFALVSRACIDSTTSQMKLAPMLPPRKLNNSPRCPAETVGGLFDVEPRWNQIHAIAPLNGNLPPLRGQLQRCSRLNVALDVRRLADPTPLHEVVPDPLIFPADPTAIPLILFGEPWCISVRTSMPYRCNILQRAKSSGQQFWHTPCGTSRPERW